jgi:hypothetical protein
MASWLLFPISPALAFLAGGVSFFQSFTGTGRLVRSTLFSPFVLAPVFFAFKGMNDYAHGRAVIVRLPECGNACERDVACSIDPATRAPMVDAERRCGNFVTLRVYNRVVKFLSRRFGPQPGAWTGHLPGREEARTAAMRGGPASSAEISRFPEIVAASRTLRRQSRTCGTVSAHELAQAIARCFAGAIAVPKPESPPSCEVTAAMFPEKDVWAGQCRGGLRAIAWGTEFVMVYDAATGREVARWGYPPRPQR